MMLSFMCLLWMTNIFVCFVCVCVSVQRKARVEAMLLDLASLKSVREFAEEFKAKNL